MLQVSELTLRQEDGLVLISCYDDTNRPALPPCHGKAREQIVTSPFHLQNPELEDPRPLPDTSTRRQLALVLDDYKGLGKQASNVPEGGVGSHGG